MTNPAPDATELPPEIDAQTLQQVLQNPEHLFLLDCREPGEHDYVAIPGSHLIPMMETPQRLSELEAAREGRLVVYCHHGVRSLQVVHYLRQQGFANAQSLAGGIDQWSCQVAPELPRY